MWRANALFGPFLIFMVATLVATDASPADNPWMHLLQTRLEKLNATLHAPQGQGFKVEDQIIKVSTAGTHCRLQPHFSCFCAAVARELFDGRENELLFIHAQVRDDAWATLQAAVRPILATLAETSDQSHQHARRARRKLRGTTDTAATFQETLQSMRAMAVKLLQLQAWEAEKAVNDQLKVNTQMSLTCTQPKPICHSAISK
jgi:hypothetical protein